MSTDTRIPEGLSLEKPTAARIYDYLLGGYHNFEVDRLAAEIFLEIYPDGRLSAQACRAFLRRVVNFLAAQGIDQFLEIGSGMPTVGSVHEVAQRANSTARVVYVDPDPVTVVHSRAMLKDNPSATAIQADAHQPDRILSHAEVKNLLDLSRPVAVLLLVILHAILDDEEAYDVVHTLRDALSPGSYIAISHGTYDNVPPEVVEQTEKLSASTPTPSKYRFRTQIREFFDGLELVEPGPVYIPLWQPEGADDVFLDQPERSLVFGGVGCKS